MKPVVIGKQVSVSITEIAWMLTICHNANEMDKAHIDFQSKLPIVSTMSEQWNMPSHLKAWYFQKAS